MMQTLQEYIPAQFWDERYQTFDITRSGHRDLPLAYNRWLYKLKSKGIRKALAKHGIDPAAGPLVEMGCGTGMYVDMWREMGVKQLTGFDIASVPVEKLNAKYPDYKFFREDLTDLGIAERHARETAQVTTAFDVLYHIMEDSDLLKSLWNANLLTKADGYFLYSDVFVNGPETKATYMHFRSLRRVSQMLSAAGFDILDRVPLTYTIVKAIDWPSEASRKRWDAFWDRVSPLINSRPELMGRLLYTVDSLALPFVKEGPSVELMICRKARTVSAWSDAKPTA